ncbi:MAG: TonB-dependent receptor domain-containing protein [Massilia sp.]
MMFKLKSMPQAIAFALAGGALSVAAMSPAMAQTDAPAAVQRVVVTGSLISRTDTETPTPVQVLTAADIQKSGKTSVAELLSDLASNGAGTLGTGFSGAFANGATGISLRGLTVGATLVLVDGHRIAPYPLSDDSQRSFVDVSSIPFDAIDHIDVLKSGASSTYGSDAIAGVVNIILKKNLNGTRVSAESGKTQHGGGKTNRASLSTGFGDLDVDGFNVFGTAEWRRQDAIKLSDRDNFAWDNRDWRDRGGNDLRLGVPTSLNGFLTATNTPFLYNPAGNNPAGVTNVNNPANYQFLDPSKCNFTAYRAGNCAIRDTTSFLQPATENVNILLGGTKKLGGDWELSAKASLFQRNSINNRGISSAYSPTTFAGSTSLNNGVLVTQIGRVASTLIPAGVAGNQFGAPARLYGIVPGIDPATTNDNTSKTTRFAVDLKGSALGWDTLVGAGITKVTTDIDYSGYLDRAALYAAINNGTWNPLGGNSPDMVNKISPRFSNSLESKLNYFDATASRELMQLGAGPLSAALGVHYDKREQNSPAASLTANGQVANTSAFVVGSTTNTAIFGELRAVPIKDVEASLQARYDHFDTYGNSFTPAANFKWTPNKIIGFRGNVAKGFRAPNPAEIGNAGSFFTFNAINDPILCVGGKNTNKGSLVNGACSINPPYVQVTDNKGLSPEKSTSYNFGIIVEPFKGLNATLDYYNIEVKNQIVTAAGNDPTFTPDFARGPATPVDISNGDGTSSVGTPSVGPIIYAKSPYINLGSTKTSGIEADVKYRFNLGGDMGRITAGLSAAHVFSYISESGGVEYQLAGTQGPSVVGGATGNPKDRAQFTLGYTRGPLDVTATMNYTSSFSTLDPSVGATSCDSTALDAGGRTYFQNKVQPAGYCEVASFTTTNLNVQYKISQNLTLKGSILNLFDRQPPFDVATYGNQGTQTSYNASLHQAGAIGRFFSLGLAYQF